MAGLTIPFSKVALILTGEITQQLAQRVTERMLALTEVVDEPINMIISSPGGHVEPGDMVYNMIQFIRPKVCIIGSGWVTSAGALIFAGAELEDHCYLPNTSFLMHQPSGGTGGSASYMEILAEQIRYIRSRFDHFFAQTTRQTIAQIRTDTQRDFWLNTTQARDYGLLGRMIASASELS